MIRVIGGLLLALVVVATVATDGHAGRVAGSRVDGAWRLVDTGAEKGMEHTKVLAGGRFVWTTTHDGKVLRTAGGRYEVRGRRYVEHVDFVSHQNDEWMVGKTFTFKRKIKGRRWHHSGKLGNTDLHEVWERVPR